MSDRAGVVVEISTGSGSMCKDAGGSHGAQVEECRAGESLCAMPGAAVVDEHRAGASRSAWSGRTEAKLGEHWAGLLGWGHRRT